MTADIPIHINENTDPVNMIEDSAPMDMSLDKKNEPPLPCAVNEHVFLNTCRPCSPGTTNKQGDDPTGGDTFCRVASCAQNAHVINNMCVPCPPGTINKAGDDPTRGDTQCSPVICGEQEYVQNHKCISCAPGTYNDAGGADSSGPNTTCKPILCAENQHVQNHTCTPCPEGATNVAGSDASGLDTFCADECTLIFNISCIEFEQSYIKASNSETKDEFGTSVALSGDTLVVGAPFESSNAKGVNKSQTNNNISASGAVYVFTRTGNTWTQQAYLKAFNPGFKDEFGQSVAISGDTIVVGARHEDSQATGINGDRYDNSARDSGAAYVFTRTGTTWTQQAYLKASNAEDGDLFGRSVAIAQDTIVVSAIYEDSNARGVHGNQENNSLTGSGAVYVFTRTGTTWIQQAYIKASNPGAQDLFGTSLAISGDTIVVGSYYEDSNARDIDGDQENDDSKDSGAVYVFTRTNNTWTQQAYLKSSNSEAEDYFGISVAISQDTLVVGAYGEDSNTTGVDGIQDNNDQLNSGAAYVFTRTDNTWTQQAYLKASNPEAQDLFGKSVAIAQDTIVVSASGEDSRATEVYGDQEDNLAPESGAAYVFEHIIDSSWVHKAYIKASNSGSKDAFGTEVALSENLLAISSALEDSNAQGVDEEQLSDGAIDSGAVYIRRLAP